VNSGFVFTTELGEPCDPRNALRAVKAAAKKAGLPGSVGLHTLRHSAASIMLDANVLPKVVSEIFGHSSISITMDIYGHLMPGASQQAMSTLSDALTG
jgi:integrase